MQATLTALNGLQRRLEVAVPATRVATEVELRLKNIARTARLKGFRPGKAPFQVVRQQYGDQVRSEVVGDLLQSSFAEAVDQEKLRPASGPRIEQISADPGADLRYTAIFEVMPDFKLKPVEQLPIEKPAASVTEADVDAMIETMRRQRPEFALVEREARDTDRVAVDFVGHVDGQPFQGGTGTDVPFVVGAGRMLKEFEDGVRGGRAGETRQVAVSFPADYASKELAGRTAQFTVTLKKVEEQRLPEVNEAFCEQFGVREGGVAALRAEVRKSMERELAEAIRNRLRAQVFEGLYRENPLEVPQAMVEEQIQALQADMARRTGAKDASQLPPRESFEDTARRRVTLGLLMGELIRSESLKVDRERVNHRLLEIAGSYPNSDEVRRQYLQSPDAMRNLESAVLEEQAIDWVVGRAQVTEKASSFSELTGFSAGGAAQ